MEGFPADQESRELSLPSATGPGDVSLSAVMSNESCRPTARASRLIASRVVFWPLSTRLTYVWPSLARAATCSCVQPSSCRAFSRASPNWRASLSVISRASTATDVARFFCGFLGNGRPDLLILSILADLLAGVETASEVRPLSYGGVHRCSALFTGRRGLAISEPAPFTSHSWLPQTPTEIAMNHQAFQHSQTLPSRQALSGNDESPRFRRPIGEDSYQSLIRVYWRFIVDNRVRAWRFIAIGHASHWRFIATTLQVHRGQPGWQGSSGRPCWPAEPHRRGGARAYR